MRPFTAFEQENVRFLVNLNVRFTQVEITRQEYLGRYGPHAGLFLRRGHPQL